MCPYQSNGSRCHFFGRSEWCVLAQRHKLQPIPSLVNIPAGVAIPIPVPQLNPTQQQQKNTRKKYISVHSFAGHKFDLKIKKPPMVREQKRYRAQISFGQLTRVF